MTHTIIDLWCSDHGAVLLLRRVRSALRLTTFALLMLGTIGGATAPSDVSADESRDGASIYHAYCSVCHGDRGDGKSRAQGSMVPPPRDFTTPDAAVDLTLPRMVASVRDGRPNTAMAGWKHQLSDDEIEAVVGFIRGSIMMPVASEDAERGRKIYADTCSVCHGDDGRGARWAASNLSPQPRNFTLPNTRAELSRGQMIHAATYGKPDTAMPGFTTQLSDEDIAATVDYILGAFVPTLPDDGAEAMQTASAGRSGSDAEQGAIEMSLPMPKGLVGDPYVGQGYYVANCVACHGLEGDGQGPRAYFILPKPRNFRHPGSRQSYNRVALFRAISRGSLGAEMPAWDTVLNDQQIADVAEYVFQTFIAPDGEGGVARPNGAGVEARARVADPEMSLKRVQ